MSGFTFNSQIDKCIPNCAKGKFYNETLLKCENCRKKCKTCFGGECTKCIHNANNINSKCECTFGYKYNKATNKCETTTDYLGKTGT